jgi:hypothetical protein
MPQPFDQHRLYGRSACAGVANAESPMATAIAVRIFTIFMRPVSFFSLFMKETSSPNSQNKIG